MRIAFLVFGATAMLSTTASAIDSFYVQNSTRNFLYMMMYGEKAARWLPKYELYPRDPVLINLESDGLYYVRLQRSGGYHEDLDWIDFRALLEEFTSIPTLDVRMLYRNETRVKNYTVQHMVPEQRVRTREVTRHRPESRTGTRRVRDRRTGKFYTETYTYQVMVPYVVTVEEVYTVVKPVWETKSHEYTVRVPYYSFEFVVDGQRRAVPSKSLQSGQ